MEYDYENMIKQWQACMFVITNICVGESYIVYILFFTYSTDKLIIYQSNSINIVITIPHYLDR